MALDFPSGPVINDTYEYENLTYVWDGEKWLSLDRTIATGATGPIGATGATGPSGSVNNVPVINSLPSSGVSGDLANVNGVLYFHDGSGFKVVSLS